MLSQLRSICDLVLRFHATQAALCQDGVLEVANREKRGARVYGQHLAGKYGVSAPPVASIDPKVPNFAIHTAKLQQIARQFQVRIWFDLCCCCCCRLL